MIELSVLLPLYNSKNIAWLALESLCRQKDIKFKWELVCAEEQDLNPVTKKEIFNYEKRLEEVNCVNINYIEVKRINLSDKIKLLANNTSDSSYICVFQAGDAFSQPYRLSQSYDFIKNKGFEWVSSQLGPFYDIKTKKVYLYDRRENPSPRGLNMATRTEYVKKLPDHGPYRGIDKWIVSNIEKVLNRNLKYVYNTSDYWKYGFDSHGINTISGRAKKFETRPDIYNGTINLHEYIDADIMNRISECDKYITRFK